MLCTKYSVNELNFSCFGGAGVCGLRLSLIPIGCEPRLGVCRAGRWGRPRHTAWKVKCIYTCFICYIGWNPALWDLLCVMCYVCYVCGWQPMGQVEWGEHVGINQLIEAETKWPPFSRRHFQIHFLQWKCMNFAYIFIEVCSLGSNKKYSSIGSDNGLTPTRRQVIFWTNDG